MERQVRVHVSGYVQGVGYRQFVKHHARKHGATGWVRNLSDGRVEMVLQGRNHLIETLLAIYKKGPMLAEVAEVVVSDEPVDSLHHEFVITS
jgi:acylphosphatase